MNEINKDPFFSVVIPVFNGEDHISKCIESILSQSFENFELIVVNDGSTDKTEEILLELSRKDCRLRILTVKNGGGFKARARGALQAKGTYVLFCDDDDYYASNSVFKKLYDMAVSEEFDFIQYGYYKKFNHLSFRCNTVRSCISVDKAEFFEKDYPILLSSRNICSNLFVNMCSKAYHRRLLENIPDLETLDRMFMGDDMVFNLYLLKDCQKALYVPDCFYVTQRLAGDTEKYRINEMHNLDLIKKYQLDFLEKWDGKDYVEVERLHHLECAEWLFLHIKKSLDHLNEKDLKEHIETILNLPAFVRAREYFKVCPEDSIAVQLLLEGDCCSYIEEARERKKGSIKERLYKALKEKVIYRI